MTTPKKGFTKAAEELIRKRPGLTSEELARIAIDQGLASSNSKDPVFSLKTTLDKEYRERRIPSVSKNRGRYYPAGYQVEPEPAPGPSVAVWVNLPEEQSQRID